MIQESSPENAPRWPLFVLIDRFVAAIEKHERLTITLLALIIGVIGGYGAIVFRFLIHSIEQIAFNTHEHLVHAIATYEWWQRFLPPVIGLTLVAPFVHWLAREAKGHGIPEVMESVTLRGGLIRPRVVLVKLLASAVSIGTGGSVGREGPIVQIGSAAGSVVGQVLKVSRRRMRILVGCGAAAGLAATFNAPIAGVLLSLEVLLGEYGTMTLSPIVVSSVMATVISRMHLGNAPAFNIPEALKNFSMASIWEVGTFLVMGVIMGLFAVLFSRSVYYSEDLFAGLKLPVWLKGMIGGAIIGTILIFIPNVAGVGYDSIEALMRGETAGAIPTDAGHLMMAFPWLIALVLFLVKIFATAVTLGAGGSGGVFAPSLFIGAAGGFFVGSLFNALLPGTVSSPGAYALVGMGALVAGATHAPMTNIIIIFEMTGDYRIILPVMLACIASTLIAQKLDPESIYTRKLARRGVILRGGRDERTLSSMKVREIMTEQFVAIDQRTPFAEMVRQILGVRQVYFPVTDEGGGMVGVIGLHDVRSHLFDQHLKHVVIARDLAIRPVITLTPDDSLLTAFERFNIKDIEQMPVVASEDPRRVIGMVSRRDLLNAYNKAVLAQGAALQG